MKAFLGFLPVQDLIKEGWPSAESYFKYLASSQQKISPDALKDDMLV